MSLTDAECKKAQPKDKQYRLSDSHGLSLHYYDQRGKNIGISAYTVNGQR